MNTNITCTRVPGTKYLNLTRGFQPVLSDLVRYNLSVSELAISDLQV